ncbi:MAG: ATP-binding protein [Planctomycetaceae bacterium]
MTSIAMDVLSKSVVFAQSTDLIGATLAEVVRNQASHVAVLDGERCIGLWAHATGEAADASLTNEAVVRGQDVRVVEPEASINKLSGLLSETHIGVIVCTNGSLAGVVTHDSLLKGLLEPEAASQSEALLEASPVCTKIVDLQSRLRYMSAAGQRRLGIVDVKRLYGRIFPPKELYTSPWWGLVTDYLELAKSGETQNLECPVSDSCGNEVWYDTTLAPVYGKNGNTLYVIVTSVDITARKVAEREARNNRSQLAHISRLSTLAEMATGVAHEINQPLAAIASYAHVAMRHVSNSEHEKACEVLTALNRQVLRAGEILRGLKNFSQDPIPSQSVIELNHLVEDVARFVAPDVRRSGATLRLNMNERKVFVAVNEVQIQQVLVNLMRNGLDAMQGMPTETRSLSVSVEQRCTDRVHVVVTDSGTGLSKDEVSEVFRAFFSTKVEGLGMGLPISRTIIEAHGGELKSETCIDGGAVFYFTLPVVPSGSQAVVTLGTEE